jgi:coatomer protein complex subunit epsilon
MFWQEKVLSSLAELLADSAIASNPMLRFVAGTVYVHEQDYNEAIRHTHGSGDLDL